MKRAIICAAVVVGLLAPAAAEAHTLSTPRANAFANSIARDLYLRIDGAIDYVGGDCSRVRAHAQSCVIFIDHANGVICRSAIRVRYASSRSYSLTFNPIGDPVCA